MHIDKRKKNTKMYKPVFKYTALFNQRRVNADNK